MKRKVFTIVFISIHIIFIILHIHRHTLHIQASYHKQKNEKLYDTLIKEKDMLTYELETLHNNETIKLYAQNELNMVPISLKNIKKVTYEN